METVAEHSPGSHRPLARTMGCSTWHPYKECLLCFLEWGLVCSCSPAGAGSLLAHLQDQGSSSGSHARALAGRPCRSPCRCFLRHCPVLITQLRSGGSGGSMNPQLHVRLGCRGGGTGDMEVLSEPMRTPGKGSNPTLGPVGSVGRGGGVEHTVAMSGPTGFPNPETSLRMAGVPDVLSKAPSLGSPRDGYSSKSAWPSLALCGGLAPCFGKLHNPGQCPAAPSAAAQPSSVSQPLPPESS